MYLTKRTFIKNLIVPFKALKVNYFKMLWIAATPLLDENFSRKL